MSVVAWFVLGLVAGLIAGRMHRHVASALALDACLGAAGAIGGGLAFSSFGSAEITAFNPFSWFAALAGAVGMLVGYRAIFRRA